MITLTLWIAASFLIVVFAVLGMSAELRLYYSNALQMISAILSGLLCYRTMLVFPSGSPMRSIWLLMGSGVNAWGIGAILFIAYPLLNNNQETPFPWYSDIGYLAFQPLLVAALLKARGTLGLTAPIWGKFLTFVVFLAALAFASWANWKGLSQEGWLMPAVAAAYTLFDPVLLAVTVLMASALRGGTAARPWWYVTAGLLSYYVANLFYNYLTLQGQYVSGAPTDIGWPVGFALIAAAAMMTHNFFTENR